MVCKANSPASRTSSRGFIAAARGSALVMLVLAGVPLFDDWLIHASMARFANVGRPERVNFPPRRGSRNRSIRGARSTVG